MSAMLLFSTTRSWESRAVRLFTWSEFSHVDIVHPKDSSLLGAVPGEGVCITDFDQRLAESSRVQLVKVPANGQLIWDKALTKLGQAYDWHAIFGLVAHRDLQREKAWTCSELVDWAYRETGAALLSSLTPMGRVTPQMLLNSPLCTTLIDRRN